MAYATTMAKTTTAARGLKRRFDFRRSPRFSVGALVGTRAGGGIVEGGLIGSTMALSHLSSGTFAGRLVRSDPLHL